MSIENLVANPGRLRILTALAVNETAEFVRLRNQTQLTDGNLASHARRLAGAGLINIEKSLRNGKPVTSLSLTITGRQALESHARRLLAALSHRRVTMPGVQSHVEAEVAHEPEVHVEPALVGAKAETSFREDWVD